MRNKKLLATFFLLIIIVGAACKKELSSSYWDAPNLPEQVFDYETAYREITTSPAADQWVTNEGATLGRVLFYDKKLSINNTISCGSCHKQAFGFADNKALSNGFELRQTTRNSMALINPSLSSAYFWDLRSNKLEEQVLMPVENHIEMGLDNFEYLEKKLASINYYPPLFADAFGSSEITEEKIADALAQFLRSMASFETRFDKNVDIEFANFSPSEKRGEAIFTGKGKCSSCHFLGTFQYTNVGNIGLDMVYADKGIAGENAGPSAEGYFKIPTLRNITLTAPYMHDGRFATLEEVIEHYNSGIKPHPGLSWELREFDEDDFTFFIDDSDVIFAEGPVEPIRLGLTAQDKKDLIAFLHTLTDEQFIRDPKFSNPF